MDNDQIYTLVVWILAVCIGVVLITAVAAIAAAGLPMLLSLSSGVSIGASSFAVLA